MDVRDLHLEDITVGDTASFERTILGSDVTAFAELSGDYNPLHTDAAYATHTSFGRPIAHGMLLGALCSTLVGMYLPGKRCLYLSQSLRFKKPVYADDVVAVRGTVTAKSVATRVLTIAVSITRGEEEVVSGEAQVQVLP
jgi:3-hydroxybutyryl-CoA dehydratase